MILKHVRILIFPVLFIPSLLFPQINTNFNVNLVLDAQAAEQTVVLFEDGSVNTNALAETRGNIIAASTAGMIAERYSGPQLLRDYLDSLKYHQQIRDDLYHLEDGRRNVAAIKELLDAIKVENFSRKVVATVEQIFPIDARVDVTIPMYVVAFGHENVDAFVRRIVWHGDNPQFVGEGEGELTIVINLSHAVNYGSALQERFVSLLGVVAHEVFHAAFGAYKETSPTWRSFYAGHTSYLDNLLDLSHNEGIAYYLSLEQQGRGRVPADWSQKTRAVVDLFNNNSAELLSPSTNPRRASKILRSANLSGYWESYGAMTGMFMAREIDSRLGRGALIETISNGPYDFFQKYVKLTREDTNLPELSAELVNFLHAR